MTKINKICLHWSAGTNIPCETDLNAYHYCIDKDGKIYEGKYKPEDNINCNDGKYAKHTGGGNTGCIGVSVCGMFGFDLRNKQTKYPLTQKQIEAMCALTSFLSNKYGIIINENTVFTHYEFDQKQKKRKGKIDITFLHFLPELNKNDVGIFIRNKTAWYKSKNVQLIKKGNYYEIV